MKKNVFKRTLERMATTLISYITEQKQVPNLKISLTDSKKEQINSNETLICLAVLISQGMSGKEIIEKSGISRKDFDELQIERRKIVLDKLIKLTNSIYNKEQVYSDFEKYSLNTLGLAEKESVLENIIVWANRASDSEVNKITHDFRRTLKEIMIEYQLSSTKIATISDIKPSALSNYLKRGKLPILEKYFLVKILCGAVNIVSSKNYKPTKITQWEFYERDNEKRNTKERYELSFHQTSEKNKQEALSYISAMLLTNNRTQYIIRKITSMQAVRFFKTKATNEKNEEYKKIISYGQGIMDKSEVNKILTKYNVSYFGLPTYKNTLENSIAGYVYNASPQERERLRKPLLSLVQETLKQMSKQQYLEEANISKVALRDFLEGETKTKPAMLIKLMQKEIDNRYKAAA